MKRASRRRVLARWLAACLIGLGSESALAEEPPVPEPEVRASEHPIEDARAHFTLGVEFFKERNYRAAQIEFRTAYQISPNYKVLYNLAQACVEVQEYVDAIKYLSQYLREGDADLPPARRQEVEGTIRALQGRLASVSILSNMSDAEIFVDDTFAGRLPLSNELTLSAGRRKLTAKKTGLVNAEAVFDLAAGEHRAVRLDFAEPIVASAAPASGSGDAHDTVRWPTAVVWTGIATGVLVVGAATMSVVAWDAGHKYNFNRAALSDPDRLTHLRSDTLTKARIADVLWGASLVTATVSVVLFITQNGSEHAPRPVSLAVSPTAVQATFLRKF